MRRTSLFLSSLVLANVVGECSSVGTDGQWRRRVAVFSTWFQNERLRSRRFLIICLFVLFFARWRCLANEYLNRIISCHFGDLAHVLEAENCFLVELIFCYVSSVSQDVGLHISLSVYTFCGLRVPGGRQMRLLELRRPLAMQTYFDEVADKIEIVDGQPRLASGVGLTSIVGRGDSLE